VHWSGRDWRLVALLIASVTLLYAPTLGFEFLSLDDHRCVVDNPWVTGGLSLASLRWAFTSLYCSNWFPMTWLSYMLDAELHGVDPRAFHATNVALHAIATTLVYRVLRRATGRPAPSFAAAMLFALHPLHVEVVAWVSERTELVAACFGLAATEAYVSWTRTGGRMRYAAVATLMALALMAKPMWVSLPILLLLLDVWPLGRIDGGPGWASALRARVVEKLPLIALSLGSCVVTLFARERAMEPAASVEVGERLANATVALARYVELTVWPVGLSVLHPHPYLPGGTPLPAVRIASSLALLLALSWLAWRLRARRPLAVGWLWFLVALLPVIGLLQVGMQAFAERYTYLPHIGLFAALAFGFDDLARSLRTRRPAAARALTAGAALLVFAFALVAHERVGAWRDTVTLYERSLAATPRSVWLLFNLGNRLFVRGDHAGAIARYESALAVWPEMPAARASLAWALATTSEEPLRDPARALVLAQEAAERARFRDANALDTLAAAHAANGDFAQATEIARIAHEIARRTRQPKLAAQIEERQRGYAAGRAHFETSK
jgi:tetratricopeptide (TPR) repeat protein